MLLVCAGRNDKHQLRIPSDNKYKIGDFVSKIAEIPVDTGNIQCVAPHWSVLTVGNDINFRIGSDNQVEYEEFTQIKICDESVKWAADGKK